MQKRKANRLFWSVVALAGITLSGCLKASDPQPQPAQAYISILHLATAPPAPAVEIYLNSEKASNSFAAGGISQTYSPIKRNAYTISFKKSGSDSLVASVPATQYDSLGFYTIVLYNRPNGHADAVLVEDDFSGLSLDKVFVRFFHMSPSISNLGPVDVFMDNTKISEQRSLADNEFNTSFNQFRTATTGYHSFTVKPTGKDSVIATTSSDVSLLAGNAYTIYLAGNTGGTGANKLSVGILRAAN